MPIKHFTIPISNLSKDQFLRNDEKYHVFLHFSDWNLFGAKNKNLIPLKDILVNDCKNFDYQEGEEYKGIPTGQSYIDEDGDIIDFQPVTIEDHPGRLKYKISNGNLLISSLRLAKSPALCFENQDVSDYVFSNGFYVFKVKEDWNKKFVLYILRSKKLKNILDNHIYRGIGISAYKKEDLLNIKIPLISKSTQDKIVSQIEPIEQKIKELKKQIKRPQEIINKVFAREFGFDENLYNEFGKGMTAGTQIAEEKETRTFNINFSEFSRSDNLRFSTRFHNIPTKKLMDILDSIKTLQIKDIIESFEKGVQPIYNPDGEIPVTKIANLKNGYVDFSEPEFITREFYSKLDDKKKLKQNDIIICATGKISLGKIDFYDYENESITTVDNYILRLNEKYNPLFIAYFFRSILGYFQIERDFTGATNQIHLYWEQISNFQIPNISLKFQQKIVSEIKEELDKQEEMRNNIEKERGRIDEIMEEVIA